MRSIIDPRHREPALHSQPTSKYVGYRQITNRNVSNYGFPRPVFFW